MRATEVNSDTIVSENTYFVIEKFNRNFHISTSGKNTSTKLLNIQLEIPKPLIMKKIGMFLLIVFTWRSTYGQCDVAYEKDKFTDREKVSVVIDSSCTIEKQLGKLGLLEFRYMITLTTKHNAYHPVFAGDQQVIAILRSGKKVRGSCTIVAAEIRDLYWNYVTLIGLTEKTRKQILSDPIVAIKHGIFERDFPTNFNDAIVCLQEYKR